MHPSDATWRSWLDGEVAPAEMAELERHLEECDICRQASSAIASDRTKVMALLPSLGGADSVPRIDDILERAARPGPRRWAAIAAMILLGIVTVAGASVATGLFQTVVEKLQGPRQAGPTEASATQAEDRVSTSIALEAGARAAVVFLSTQTAGTITIAVNDQPRVEVVASRVVPYKVQQGQVSITNGGTNADYLVRIPRRLLRAEIRVADRVVFTKDGNAITALVTPDSAGTYVLPFP